MKAVRLVPYCLLIAIVGSLLLTGCAPVISREVLREVDKDVSFEQLLKNPEAYSERTLLLGGNIIEAQNLADKTLIFVLQRSLGFRGKPAEGDVSKGRFIISVTGFLDPAIYRHGRKITVAGRVMGKEVRPLGEIEYTYPVIEKKELYLWPEESPSSEPQLHIGVGVGVGF